MINMIKFNDVFRINVKLMMRDWDDKSIPEKKELLNQELINYLCFKLSELNSDKALKYAGQFLEVDSSIMRVGDLMNIIAGQLPENKREELSQVIHFILYIAGTMQQYSITWWSESNDDLKDNPVVDFDANGYWDKLVTHQDMDIVKTFNLVYEIFTDYFMVDKIDGNNLAYKI